MNKVICQSAPLLLWTFLQMQSENIDEISMILSLWDYCSKVMLQLLLQPITGMWRPTDNRINAIKQYVSCTFPFPNQQRLLKVDSLPVREIPWETCQFVVAMFCSQHLPKPPIVHCLSNKSMLYNDWCYGSVLYKYFLIDDVNKNNKHISRKCINNKRSYYRILV